MMKSVTVTSLLLALSVSAIAAEQCALATLQPLLNSSAVTACADQSKYSFVPPKRPTDAQLVGICKSSACNQVLRLVKALNLPDCDVGTVSIKTDVLDRVTKSCEALAAASGSSSGSAGSVPVPTTKPENVTTAPNATATPTPVPTKKNVTKTTAPPPTEASQGDEPEVTADASGSGDYEIQDNGQTQETEAPATAAPVTKAPTRIPTTSSSVRVAVTTSVLGVVMMALVV